MFCIECGTQQIDTAKFCHVCGTACVLPEGKVKPGKPSAVIDDHDEDEDDFEKPDAVDLSARAEVEEPTDDLDEAELILLAEADDQDSIESLGLLYERAENWEEARRWYLRGAELGNFFSFRRLGILSQADGDRDEAITWYEQAIRAGDVISMWVLGDLYFAMNDFKLAEKWLLKSAKKGDHVGMSALADFYRSTGKEDKAETWYLAAIEGGHEDSYRSLGQIREKKGDTEGALALYSSYRELVGIVGNWDLARIHVTSGDLEKAEGLFHELVEAGDADALFEIGSIKFTQGDLEGAEEFWLETLDRGEEISVPALDKGNNAQASYRLSRLSKARGDLEAESSYLDTAFALLPDFRQFEEGYFAKWAIRAYREGDSKAFEDFLEDFNYLHKMAEVAVIAWELDFEPAFEHVVAYFHENPGRNGLFEDFWAPQIRQLLEKEAEGGDPRAMGALASHIEDFEHDFATAEGWYLKAIKHGNKSARERLVELYIDTDNEAKIDSLPDDSNVGNAYDSESNEGCGTPHFRRYFEFVGQNKELKSGMSSKFWQVTIEGTEVQLNFGKIGTQGQSKRKSFETAKEAEDYVSGLIKEKKSKGYQELLAPEV